jgi:hypothetical protein
VANAEGESRERATPSNVKSSPARPGSRFGGHALPQAGGGKARARKDDAIAPIDFDPHSETLEEDYMAFGKRSKAMPPEERAATVAKFEAAFARRKVEAVRVLNESFRFWLTCSHKPCRRMSRCAGDAMACFERWWPVVPEAAKVHTRVFLKCCCQGMSEDEALRQANATLEHFADHIARVDAEKRARLRVLEETRNAQPSRAEENLANTEPEKSGTPPERHQSPRISVL